VGSGSTIVSTGAHHYTQGAPHLSAQAQQAFAALAHQLDPYSSYLAAVQSAQNSATSANPYSQGAQTVTGHPSYHHPNSSAVNPYAAPAAP